MRSACWAAAAAVGAGLLWRYFSQRRRRVCVVGAGVVGLSCALQLSELENVDVRISSC
jgi:hypothetical protein